VDYKLSGTIDVPGHVAADAVVENSDGEWLADWDAETNQAMPLCDEGGEFYAAPEGWWEMIDGVDHWSGYN